MTPDVLHLLGRKALDAKAKHRWLTACAQYRPFSDKPGVLRVAIVLFELYDPKLGYAYPSRRYLSERLGSPQENISKWVSILKGDKRPLAIRVVPARQVEKRIREATKRTSKRANYYTLNFEWAEEVLGCVPPLEEEEERAA